MTSLAGGLDPPSYGRRDQDTGVRINVGELSCLVIGANFAESIALKSGMDIPPFQSLPIGLPLESEVNYST